MDKKYIINKQGKDFVLYEGLLDAAHQQGLKRISTVLIQIPHEDNGNVAVVSAEVETATGTFSGIGDASPGNVNRMIAPHLIRMAETRAKARALRDAINVGETALEELADDDGGAPLRIVNRDTGEINEAKPPQQQSIRPSGSGITAPQRRTITALCSALREELPPDLDSMSHDEAEGIIAGLKSRQAAK